MKARSLILAAFALVTAFSAANAQTMDLERLELIDSVIVDAIMQKTIPGAVVGIVKDGKMVRTGEQIMMGGNESYITVCRKHFTQGQLYPPSWPAQEN